MARVRLTRTSILDACAALLAEGHEITMVRLGARLGADPSAVYRHFRDKDEMLRALGDRALDGVAAGLPSVADGWRPLAVAACLRLRTALLDHPDVVALVRGRPPMQRNEFALTEAVIDALRAAGLDDAAAASAYHALMELTVGSAVLDAAVHALAPAARRREYAAWRRAYAALDPVEHPHTVAVARHLYAGGADARFRYTLDRLLDGIAATAVPTATAAPATMG